MNILDKFFARGKEKTPHIITKYIVNIKGKPGLKKDELIQDIEPQLLSNKNSVIFNFDPEMEINIQKVDVVKYE